MRSAASIKGHPIHPMLVCFPFAFLTGAWAFEIAGTLLRRRDLRTVSRHLIPTGVAAGLLAAVPGVIDYTKSVPPKSSAKERATNHALLNVTALTLFSAGWALGRRFRNAGFVLQSLGVSAISAAGWMGGTLAYRNQIGVDHRYANAGKWHEESRAHSESRALVSAAAAGELGVNQMMLVHAGDERIAVARTEDGYAAFEDRCTHKGGPLSDGALICGVVQCPWHGSQFDVRTGDVKCGPAQKKIKVYELETPHRPVVQQAR
jgi:nitrite reductase/ring-hydroxylating ferredoxin subunit/uncharacterized membrane protein